MKISAYLLISLLITSCKNDAAQENLADLLDGMPYIEGKMDYLDSPYVTAGNRVYMVGQQDGSFAEIGWHIKGEMGGIWNHPIKLMDGFNAELLFAEDRTPLDRADKFINYPLANVHQYSLSKYQLSVERWQIVPDDKEGIAIQYIFHNQGDNTVEFDLNFTAHAD
ncbi:MAG: glycogen debranching protein, partial [Flavobacteriaceae bacterium]|nr:glycogen debranching protein [Flavobacteriaceae bacterium]